MERKKPSRFCREHHRLSEVMEHLQRNDGKGGVPLVPACDARTITKAKRLGGLVSGTEPRNTRLAVAAERRRDDGDERLTRDGWYSHPIPHAAPASVMYQPGGGVSCKVEAMTKAGVFSIEQQHRRIATYKKPAGRRALYHHRSAPPTPTYDDGGRSRSRRSGIRRIRTARAAGSGKSTGGRFSSSFYLLTRHLAGAAG